MIKNILIIVSPTICYDKEFYDYWYWLYCSFGQELKIPKEPQHLYFGTEKILSSLGSSQFRFWDQSY